MVFDQDIPASSDPELQPLVQIVEDLHQGLIDRAQAEQLAAALPAGLASGVKMLGLVETLLQYRQTLDVMSAEQQEQQAEMEGLRQTQHSLNMFVSVAAHDLRNPIAYVQMIANLLADTDAGLSIEERREFFDDLMRQVSYMSALLKDLLEISRFNAGKLELRPVASQLADQLVAITDRHDRMAIAKASRVLLENTPAGLVWADPDRLRQVLDNLISNAVKYSPPSSLVRVWAEQRPEHWWVAVQDSGPGIKSEEQAVIFQEFSRLSVRPTGGETSTGLGLAITRRLVAALGGQIGVESQVGQGALFWFTLPYPTTENLAQGDGARGEEAVDMNWEQDVQVTTPRSKLAVRDRR